MKPKNEKAVKLRVLFISKELIAGDLALKLKREGCNVKLFIQDPKEQTCFDGMVAKTTNWRKELQWVGKEGLIVFDDVGYGKHQDSLRSKGYRVVGGSMDGDKLELNRIYGQQILKQASVCEEYFPTKIFTIKKAIPFIQKQKGAWVIKSNNHDNELTYVGQLEDGSDVLEVLENYKKKFGSSYKISIQKRALGIEIAIGRFFNGNEWVGPSVINFEHKHLCNDDIGPLGGETGTLMWYEENDNNLLFKRTLSKLKPHLIKHNHRGYVDINCIVNKDKIFPLEITSRFGSSTIETQQEIHTTQWKDFLCAIADGTSFELKFKKGYAINVALTIPPFPYKTSDKKIINDGLNIYFTNSMNEEEFQHIHYEGVMSKNDDLYTAGRSGYTLYVTGLGKNIEEARQRVYGVINKIVIPKMFYRTDIGTRFIRKDGNKLKEWGWI